MTLLTHNSTLTVATRSSPLALAQVAEVHTLVKERYPDLSLEIIPLTTVGDRDLKTSLRTLGKDDFFTRELDDAVLSGQCRIAIHAAKDLPEPLPPNLSIVALTKGVDSGDSVVLPNGCSLYDLPSRACIATSSVRREEAVRQLRADLTFCDVRGPIHQRLALLNEAGGKDNERKVHGVVVAEAALMRLGLTHLNRMRLPGFTTPLQGRLAIIARSDDFAMAELFAFPHVPKTASPTTYRQLYVGLTPPPFPPLLNVVTIHCPLIATIPRSYDRTEIANILHNLRSYSHYIFTSKCAVQYFFESLSHHKIPSTILRQKIFIAVGEGTAKILRKNDLKSTILIPSEATAEGICTFLTNTVLPSLSLEKTRFLWPHSALSRRVIAEFLTTRDISWEECILYDTEICRPQPLPSLEGCDEIFFTSPSTIDAFCQIYGQLPIHKKALRCYGPITTAHLRTCLKSSIGSR